MGTKTKVAIKYPLSCPYFMRSSHCVSRISIVTIKHPCKFYQPIDVLCKIENIVGSGSTSAKFQISQVENINMVNFLWLMLHHPIVIYIQFYVACRQKMQNKWYNLILQLCLDNKETLFLGKVSVDDKHRKVVCFDLLSVS